MALLWVLPPRNPLTDYVGTALNTPNGMSIGSGGDLHEGVKC